MKDKQIDLNTSGNLPESQASYEGGSNGAMHGVNRQALKRGFTEAKHDESHAIEHTTNPGFAGRAHGWER